MGGDAPYRCVPDLLAAWAERAPDAPAILAPGRAPLTYGALARQAEATGRTLSRLGVGGQDRIALIVPNGPELAAAVLEVAAHAVAAPLNPDLPASDLTAALEAPRTPGPRRGVEAVVDAPGVEAERVRSEPRAHPRYR